MPRYFITAIHTDSGKTIASAILVEALQADCWKPIQAGLPRDTDTVKSLVLNKQSVFHKEAYLLTTPASPHAAARIDQVDIQLDMVQLPPTSNQTLVIEGAGGVLVPLNEDAFVIDLAAQLEAEVILVANLYLGSINHTLLTVQELKRRNVKVKGIIFNGTPNPASESIILRHSGYPCLLRILPEPIMNASTVRRYADQLAASSILTI